MEKLDTMQETALLSHIENWVDDKAKIKYTSDNRRTGYVYDNGSYILYSTSVGQITMSSTVTGVIIKEVGKHVIGMVKYSKITDLNIDVRSGKLFELIRDDFSKAKEENHKLQKFHKKSSEIFPDKTKKVKIKSEPITIEDRL
jgi:hypothetical protein